MGGMGVCQPLYHHWQQSLASLAANLVHARLDLRDLRVVLGLNSKSTGDACESQW